MRKVLNTVSYYGHEKTHEKLHSHDRSASPLVPALDRNFGTRAFSMQNTEKNAAGGQSFLDASMDVGLLSVNPFSRRSSHLQVRLHPDNYNVSKSASCHTAEVEFSTFFLSILLGTVRGNRKTNRFTSDP